uniref:Chemotaxis protein n=1 Tax=Aliivibrio wodanis TaxID=80852 RepID=A0A5Q4ZPK7_9GAMM|nr:hypothetical protein AW0309160_01708 [Aliivibrio wodanis]
MSAMSLKKAVVLISLLLTNQAWAGICPITVKNDVILTSVGEVKVENTQDKLRINKNGHVFINDNELKLTLEQKQAIEEYQQQLANYLPSIVDFTDKGFAAASEFVSDIETSFNAEGSFESVKEKINDYKQTAKQQFYQGKDLVLEQNFFQDIETGWKQDLELMVQSLDKELFSSVFNSLSNKMKEGEFNFSELQQQFSDVQSSINTKIKEHKQEMKKEAGALCDSATEIADEEQQLHELIPELKAYPAFTI